MRGAGQRGVVLDDYSNVKRRFDAIGARPARAARRAVLAGGRAARSEGVGLMFGRVQLQRR